jgi:hypothetical protein
MATASKSREIVAPNPQTASRATPITLYVVQTVADERPPRIVRCSHDREDAEDFAAQLRKALRRTGTTVNLYTLPVLLEESEANVQLDCKDDPMYQVVVTGVDGKRRIIKRFLERAAATGWARGNRSFAERGESVAVMPMGLPANSKIAADEADKIAREDEAKERAIRRRSKYFDGYGSVPRRFRSQVRSARELSKLTDTVRVIFCPNTLTDGDDGSEGHLHMVMLNHANEEVSDDGEDWYLDDRGPETMREQLSKLLRRKASFLRKLALGIERAEK